MTKVGSIVWVRPGLGDHEEPATVLQSNCHFEDPYYTSSSSFDEEGNRSKVKDKEKQKPFKDLTHSKSWHKANYFSDKQGAVSS